MTETKTKIREVFVTI